METRISQNESSEVGFSTFVSTINHWNAFLINKADGIIQLMKRIYNYEYSVRHWHVKHLQVFLWSCHRLSDNSGMDKQTLIPIVNQHHQFDSSGVIFSLTGWCPLSFREVFVGALAMILVQKLYYPPVGFYIRMVQDSLYISALLNSQS
jgi:hypothetical protein